MNLSAIVSQVVLVISPPKHSCAICAGSNGFTSESLNRNLSGEAKHHQQQFQMLHQLTLRTHLLHMPRTFRAADTCASSSVYAAWQKAHNDTMADANKALAPAYVSSRCFQARMRGSLEHLQLEDGFLLLQIILCSAGYFGFLRYCG